VKQVEELVLRTFLDKISEAVRAAR